MADRRRSTPRRPSHVNRQRYELLIEIYLRDCYAKRTVARVSELAQFLEANREHLSRATASSFGQPLSAVLRRKQLDYAAHLLEVTPLPIDEIALAAAFGHRSTFYRVFRRAYGMTPFSYRRNATKCD